MKTTSNMGKILANLYIFKNFRESSHQYENYIKYVKYSNRYNYFRKLSDQYENFVKCGQNSGQPAYFQKFYEIKSSV